MPWNQKRYPLQDPEMEGLRTQNYWKWLGENAGEFQDKTQILQVEGDGYHLVQLQDEADADYEALYMQHSIGHSWAKYSGIGNIFSIRDKNQIPQATFLVDQGRYEGKIIHAREAGNARLSASNQGRMERFCRGRNWKIVADPYPFDFFPGSPNAIMIFVHRDGNEKSFDQVVLPGGVDPTVADQVISSISVGSHWNVALLTEALGGYRVFGGENLEQVELQLLAGTDQPITAGLEQVGFDAFIEKMKAMAQEYRETHKLSFKV